MLALWVRSACGCSPAPLRFFCDQRTAAVKPRWVDNPTVSSDISRPCCALAAGDHPRLPPAGVEDGRTVPIGPLHERVRLGERDVTLDLRRRLSIRSCSLGDVALRSGFLRGPPLPFLRCRNRRDSPRVSASRFASASAWRISASRALSISYVVSPSRSVFSSSSSARVVALDRELELLRRDVRDADGLNFLILRHPGLFGRHALRHLLRKLSRFAPTQFRRAPGAGARILEGFEELAASPDRQYVVLLSVLCSFGAIRPTRRFRTESRRLR